MNSSASGLLATVTGVLLAYATVLVGHIVVQTQLTDPRLGGVLWPVSVGGALVMILVVTLLALVVLLELLEGIASPELLGRTTYTLVGGAGLFGTSLGIVRIVVEWGITSGAPPTPGALIALVLVAGPVAYASYRLVQLERIIPPLTRNDEQCNPEYVRDTTTQWATEEQTHRQSSSEIPTTAVSPNEIRTDSQPRNRSDQTENDLTELEFDWTTDTGVDFNDVGGMDELKTELTRDVVKPLTTYREKAEKLGVTPANIVFYGPPGTGKTYLAEALATELGLPFVKLSGAAIQSKWINESSQKVNALFDEAEVVADQAGGAVVFIDELDSVLKTRDTGRAHEEDTKVVNEFLNQLETTADRNIVFIGATNRIESLDKAGIRPGRIEKRIHIGLPDQQARKEILHAQLADRPNNLYDDHVEQIACWTQGMSAAELEQIIDDAARSTLDRSDDHITWLDIRRVVSP